MPNGATALGALGATIAAATPRMVRAARRRPIVGADTPADTQKERWLSAAKN